MRKFAIAALGASTLVAALVLLVVGVAPRFSGAADHLDAPLVAADGRTDINDVYLFESGSNTVMVMTVNPLAGVLSPTSFSPKATYNFKIDNTGDAVADIVYTATFSPPSENASVKAQKITLTRSGVEVARGKVTPNLGGAAGSPNVIPVDGGGSLYAGVNDDPFFFDLLAFNAGAAFCPGGVGSNFFTGLNVSAVVLEVPSSSLGSTPSDTTFGVWGTTEIAGAQIDRMGRPAINTVFIPTNPFETGVPSQENAFNATPPVNDVALWTPEVVDTLLALSALDGSPYTAAQAATIAGILLPDILTIDTADAAGFPNGRGLADDVINTELFIVTGGLFGGSAVLATDCVANDSAFSGTFPYLAPSN